MFMFLNLYSIFFALILSKQQVNLNNSNASYLTTTTTDEIPESVYSQLHNDYASHLMALPFERASRLHQRFSKLLPEVPATPSTGDQPAPEEEAGDETQETAPSKPPAAGGGSGGSGGVGGGSKPPTVPTEGGEGEEEVEEPDTTVGEKPQGSGGSAGGEEVPAAETESTSDAEATDPTQTATPEKEPPVANPPVDPENLPEEGGSESDKEGINPPADGATPENLPETDDDDAIIDEGEGESEPPTSETLPESEPPTAETAPESSPSTPETAPVEPTKPVPPKEKMPDIDLEGPKIIDVNDEYFCMKCTSLDKIAECGGSCMEECKKKCMAETLPEDPIIEGLPCECIDWAQEELTGKPVTRDHKAEDCIPAVQGG